MSSKKKITKAEAYQLIASVVLKKISAFNQSIQRTNKRGPANGHINNPQRLKNVIMWICLRKGHSAKWYDTRTFISNHFGISLPTVDKIIKELKNLGFVIYNATTSKFGGKEYGRAIRCKSFSLPQWIKDIFALCSYSPSQTFPQNNQTKQAPKNQTKFGNSLNLVLNNLKT